MDIEVEKSEILNWVISQAIHNNFTIITNDSKFKLYPVQLL